MVDAFSSIISMGSCDFFFLAIPSIFFFCSILFIGFFLYVFIFKHWVPWFRMGQPVLPREHPSYQTLWILRIWREICHLPETNILCFLFLSPFGQAVKLQTPDPGIFFRGKCDLLNVLRSQILSLPEPVYSWKLEMWNLKINFEFCLW